MAELSWRRHVDAATVEIVAANTTTGDWQEARDHLVAASQHIDAAISDLEDAEALFGDGVSDGEEDDSDEDDV